MAPTPPSIHTEQPKPEYLQDITGNIAAERGDRRVVLLSDYDGTLSPSSAISPDVAYAAQDLREAGVALVIATARLATNPRLLTFWKAGLMAVSEPILVENGGSMAYYAGEGELQFEDLVPQSERDKIAGICQQIHESRSWLGIRPYTEVKMGRTMLDLYGGLGNNDQLMDRLDVLINDSSLRVVDAHETVTVQSRQVHKLAGFSTYLETQGLAREDVYMVGMGDAPNDAEILREADLSIAFNPRVAPLQPRVVVPDGAYAAPSVLRAIADGMQPGVEPGE